MRLDRLLLDPLKLIPFLFGAQALFWYFWMPASPVTPGAAPRYHGDTGLALYALFLTLLVLGVVLGRGLFTPMAAQETPEAVSPATLERFQRLAKWTLLLTVVGEIVYVRTILQSPWVILESIRGGALADLADSIRSEHVLGLSSLNNLFVIPTAIFGLLGFNRTLAPDESARYRKRLLIVGAVTLFHSMFLAARMIFVYYLVIAFAAYLIGRGAERTVRGSVLLGVVIGMILVVWGGETLRGGLLYATLHNTSLLSGDTQQYVMARLVEGYFGSDFNNALVLLNNPPSMQFLSTTPFGSILHLHSFGELADFTSLYATVNVLGLWWYDCGWLTGLVALGVGLGFGLLYSQTLRHRHDPTFASITFLICVPAFFALLRSNYFGVPIFLLPAGFLGVWWVVERLKKGSYPWLRAASA